MVFHACRIDVPDVPTMHKSTGWEVLDSVNVEEVFETRFQVLQNCPHHLRGRFQHVARCALGARHQAARVGDRSMELRAWTLFCLLPLWLLQRPAGRGRVSKAELCDRFDQFGEGQWRRVHEAAWRQASMSDSERQERPTPKAQSG